MNYKTLILGPPVVGISGLFVANSTGIITLLEALEGIQAVSLVTILIMLYRWADME